jgi:hypothetical protein
METKTTPRGPKAGGLLLEAFKAGKIEEIRWTEIKVGDLVITVAEDALKAKLGDREGVRLPVTYLETLAICRELDCIAPTQAICDAVFAQAKAQLTLVPLVRTAADSMKMTTTEFTLRFNDGVERQLASCDRSQGGLIAGAWKYWILHPRIVEKGAVNYGFWDKSKRPPCPVQNVGARHDAGHYDYSQLLQPVKRKARKASTGEEVDLLDYFVQHDRIPAAYIERFKPGAADHEITSFAEPEGAEVNLLEVLTAAGVNVKAADGWEKRGRPGFQPKGIMLHHTAGPRGGDAPTLALCISGRPDLSGPLCHIVLGRSGTAHLIAANVANHAGPGAAEVLDRVVRDEPVTGNANVNCYKDSQSGNAFFYGIEVENAGVQGDPYPQAQIDALVDICAALCSAHGWTSNRIVHHRQWTARKIDMSYRGDIPGLVAQKLDAGVVSFCLAEADSEPMWEQETEGENPGRTSPGDE